MQLILLIQFFNSCKQLLIVDQITETYENYSALSLKTVVLYNVFDGRA